MDPLSMLTGREKAVKAVKINNIELLEKLLIKDGVDAFHRKVGYPQPDSATLAAAEMGRIGILKLFHSHQETRSKDQPRITDPVVLLAACVGISVDSISYLIELGMCANTCFPQGHRPLHAVVKCGITRCEGSFRALMGQFKRREIYQRSDRTTRDADLHGIATIGTGSEIPGVRMGQSSHERPLRRPIHVTNGRAGDIAYTRRRLETDETHSSTHGDTHNTAQGERDERIQRWPHISTVGVTNSHAHHAASGALQNGARHDADESVHAHAVYGTHSRTHGGSRVYKTIPLLTKCQFNCHYDRICTCQHDRYGNRVKSRPRKNNNRGCRHRQPYTTMASVQAHNCNEATGHQSRRLDCLVRLVKLGADPALRDGYGCTPLHYSVWCGMANEMLFLLHVAPELLTMADERGNTPLHYAAFTGNEEIICHLLKIGANLNAANMWGETPLHMTVTSHCAPALRLLLRWGANVSLRMEDGKRPLDLARAVGFVEGAAELGSHTGVPTLKRLAMQRATSLNSLSLTRNLESQWDRSESDVANSTQSALSNSVMAGSVDTQSDWLQLLVGTEDLGDVFGFGVECCQCCISRETNLYRYA